MSRYIDVDTIHEKYDKYANHSSIGRGNGKTLARFLDWLDDQPTADVVEVVRCKNCRYFELQDLSNSKHNTQWCILNGFNPQGNDYCSYGERKENEV